MAAAMLSSRGVMQVSFSAARLTDQVLLWVQTVVAFTGTGQGPDLKDDI